MLVQVELVLPRMRALRVEVLMRASKRQRPLLAAEQLADGRLVQLDILI